MLYLIGAYWPFLLAALAAGIAAGWWYRDPRSGDEVSAWLEREPDEAVTHAWRENPEEHAAFDEDEASGAAAIPDMDGGDDAALQPYLDLPAMRPAGLPGPRNGVTDDLQRIRGIGRRNEQLLNSL